MRPVQVWIVLPTPVSVLASGAGAGDRGLSCSPALNDRTQAALAMGYRAAIASTVGQSFQKNPWLPAVGSASSPAAQVPDPIVHLVTPAQLQAACPQGLAATDWLYCLTLEPLPVQIEFDRRQLYQGCGAIAQLRQTVQGWGYATLPLAAETSLQFPDNSRSCTPQKLPPPGTSWQGLLGEGLPSHHPPGDRGSVHWLPVILTAKGPVYGELIGSTLGPTGVTPADDVPPVSSSRADEARDSPWVNAPAVASSGPLDCNDASFTFHQPIPCDDAQRQALYALGHRLLRHLQAPPAVYLLQIHRTDQAICFDRLWPFPAAPAIASLSHQVPDLLTCHWACLLNQPIQELLI